MGAETAPLQTSNAATTSNCHSERSEESAFCFLVILSTSSSAIRTSYIVLCKLYFAKSVLTCGPYPATLSLPMTTRFAVVALVLPILLTSCNTGTPGPRIQVAASIFPLADITRNVGKEMVDVYVLIPPGASPHTFEPSPREFKKFGDVQLFVTVGAGFEFWAEKLITAVATESLLVIRASQGIEMIPNVAHAHQETKLSPAGIREGNPHIWLDPSIAKKIAYQIAGALAKLDHHHARFYMENANEYVSLIDSLDGDIQEAVSGFQTKDYVAFHPAWEYFAKRYGLNQVGIIEESPGRDPTPKQLKRIVENIGKSGIRAVFSEPQLSAKVASAIAEEANIRVLMLDPLGGENIPGRDSYLDLMRYNLDVMRDAMQ